jgi:leukotriene-A4 hydrolase
MMDPSSHSKPDEVVVTHLDWTIKVDFEGRYLKGTATYSVRRLQPAATALNLDTAHLEIESVTSKATTTTPQGPEEDGGSEEEVSLAYTLHPLDDARSHLGRRLEIVLPNSNGGNDQGNTTTTDPKNHTFTVTIAYRTTAASSALQWLPPSQTAGKKYPYLFTQCQAIHARSLVPCQDRCGVKWTYRATCTVPAWSTCVMSAILRGTSNDDDDDEGDDNCKVYTWEQPLPISSYLLALAVGELEKRDVSDRCSVWSEPGVVDRAAFEFAETESFLAAAERISGRPYAWGRYDVLCLPPSFPFGGMENPCLTFVTPTLLAGDRSLADVVAHEISHSWTGECLCGRVCVVCVVVVAASPFCAMVIDFSLSPGRAEKRAEPNNNAVVSVALAHKLSYFFVVQRQPSDQRDVGPLLAERGLDDVVPTQDHGPHQGRSQGPGF